MRSFASNVAEGFRKRVITDISIDTILSSACPPAMPTPPRIPGTFRITEMDEYDQDFVDAEVEGYIRFDSATAGEFQFGYACGQMTVLQTTRDGKPAAEWTWTDR